MPFNLALKLALIRIRCGKKPVDRMNAGRIVAGNAKDIGNPWQNFLNYGMQLHYKIQWSSSFFCQNDKQFWHELLSFLTPNEYEAEELLSTFRPKERKDQDLKLS